VVPFVEILGAIKGVSSLLADSSAWLQPLLQEAALKQLNEFAFATLPGLTKLYGRNARVQDLARAIYACMQGQVVEVGEDVDAPVASSGAAAAAAPASTAGASESQLLRPVRTAGPVAEGFEGKGRSSKKGKKANKKKGGNGGGSLGGSRPGSATGAGPSGTAAAAAAEEQEPVQQQEEAAAAAADDAARQPAADAGAAAEQPKAPAVDAGACSSSAEAAVASEAAVAVAAAEDVAGAAQAAAAVAAAMSTCSSPRSAQEEVDALQVHLSPRDVAAETAEAGELPLSTSCNEAAQATSSSAAAAAAVAEPAPAAAAQPSARKRTLKGLFKSLGKASGRKKAAGPAAAAEATANEVETTGAAAGPVEQQVEEQQESREAANPPSPFAAEPDFSRVRPSAISLLPSGASSMSSLSNAGFERPPDLPWEAHAEAAELGGGPDADAAGPAAAAGVLERQLSVPRTAAMYERIAAVNRLAAASRLSSGAGRSLHAGTSGSGGGDSGALPDAVAWELPGATQQQDDGLGDALMAQAAAADSPMMAPQGQEMRRDAEEAEGEQQQQPGGVPPASPLGRRLSLLGNFRGLLPSQRTAALERRQQLLQERELEAAGEQQQLQDEQQLAEELHSKQEVAAVALSAQEVVQDGLQSPLSGVGSDPMDGAIAAAWGSEQQPQQQQPQQPKEKKGRMKGMLSMLRRGNAARAATAAATATARRRGDTTPTAPEAEVTAEVRLPLEALADLADAAADADAAASAAGMSGGDGAPASPLGSQPDASEDFDEDQPAKSRRVTGLMARIRVFTQQGGKEHQQAAAAAAAAAAAQQLPHDALGGRHQGLRGLKFTAKIMKAMGDRRQSRVGEWPGGCAVVGPGPWPSAVHPPAHLDVVPAAAVDALTAVGADDQAFLPLESLPSAASLQMLRVLLELLMAEIKAETKKHLMIQLQMAAVAAAGTAGGLKPDASLARPLKQVKAMIKAVHAMQLAQGFPAPLLAAADLSDLWAGTSCGASLAAAATLQQQARQQAQAAAEAAASSCSDEQQQPSSSNAAQLQRPAPVQSDAKPLQPWSLYSLLFEDNSEGSFSSDAAALRGSVSFAAARVAAADSSRGSPASEAQELGEPDSGPDAADALRQQAAASFPSALIAACMQQLEHMPAELPLMALQVLWDGRRLLQQCGLLEAGGLLLLKQQEQQCMACFMQQLVPTAYEHFKVSHGGVQLH
jgi:hypothetical protein